MHRKDYFGPYKECFSFSDASIKIRLTSLVSLPLGLIIICIQCFNLILDFELNYNLSIFDLSLPIKKNMFDHSLPLGLIIICVLSFNLILDFDLNYNLRIFDIIIWSNARSSLKPLGLGLHEVTIICLASGGLGNHNNDLLSKSYDSRFDSRIDSRFGR